MTRTMMPHPYVERTHMPTRTLDELNEIRQFSLGMVAKAYVVHGSTWAIGFRGAFAGVISNQLDGSRSSSNAFTLEYMDGLVSQGKAEAKQLDEMPVALVEAAERMATLELTCPICGQFINRSSAVFDRDAPQLLGDQGQHGGIMHAACAPTKTIPASEVSHGDRVRLDDGDGPFFERWDRTEREGGQLSLSLLANTDSGRRIETYDVDEPVIVLDQDW